LDAGSEWAANVLPTVLLREGHIDEARQAARKMSDNKAWFGPILQTCLQPDSADQLDKVVRDATPALLGQRDPEFRYHQGAVLAFCGQRQLAARLLKSAIDQNYCATEALQRDPLLAKLRYYPEFDALTAASTECHKKFLAGRNRRAE
jgi:hypothetical protein